MSQILKGAPVAAAISEELKIKCQKLIEQGITPKAAIVRVGERPDDLSYERAALKRFDSIGIAVSRFILPENCTEAELLDTIDRINNDDSIHSCLMFRPLPDKAMEKKASERLDPRKDIDCMTDISLAGVFAGNGSGYPPCTAQAVIELCDHYGIELEGKNVAVIGRSLVIGRPVSMLLQRRNATVTMCHTRTRNMQDICQRSDIIVAAAGKAKLVTEDYLKHDENAPSQIVIDVGVNVLSDGTLVGDVDSEAEERWAASYTPVPGGVGSVTTAVLAKHTVMAALSSAGSRL
ncbi:MAG: bifunctional 5,10-methylene-tetrahydrofolate dehydrogenase/5,10-methylene-tetrahydrofolate cyclohydrolase [Lachnospiraceae bacterium]|nr:bifunctional 5,10-methylene-tetrahydrofolate dehydrogenase/5,10-methylene-tetrahydrofolate cyclohydrolase [Lachnospiraceae bacterium]